MKMTRRDMLKASAAFGAFNIIPARVLWGAETPSNQLTRALIGFGCIAHSSNHLQLKGSRLVGLCDPFAHRAAEGLACAEKAGWGKVRDYGSFLKLLEDPGVDVVHICTPPHWHGVQSVMAAKAGKDIWCEKPMTRTVGEGKRVMEVVKAQKRMFRLNTWFRFQSTFYGFGTTVEPIRQVVENGLRGDARRVAVGETDQARALERQMVLAVRDAAEADQRARQLVRRRGRAPEDLRGDDVKRSEGGGRLQELTT